MGIIELLLVAAVLAAAGQLLLKLGSGNSGAFSVSNPDILLKMLTSPQIMLGLAAHGISAVAYVAALSKTSLGYAYPFTALTFVIVMLSSWLLLKEPMSAAQAVGAAMIFGGFLVASR